MSVSRINEEETELIDGAEDDPLEIRAQLAQSTQIIARLQDALTQERAASASLRAEMEAKPAGGGEKEPRARPPKAFLVPLWAVIGVRLLLGLAHGDVNLFLADVAAVGCASILLEHWVKAQLRDGMGLLILKSLFLTVGLWVFVAYLAMNARGEHDIPPMGALLCFSFVMLLVLSPFCAWLMDGAASFARHPITTVREWFA
jgi:hypothetical protein